MSADKLAQAINWNVSKLTDCETAKQLLWKAPIKLHTITSFRDFSLKSGNLQAIKDSPIFLLDTIKKITDSKFTYGLQGLKNQL